MNNCHTADFQHKNVRYCEKVTEVIMLTSKHARLHKHACTHLDNYINKHGINCLIYTGQFWNIPIDVVRYSQSFGGAVRSDTYEITVNYPGQRRQFVGLLHPLTWELESRQCLYVGNRQGGPIDEVDDPNDSVLQGKYDDYEIGNLFDTEFDYGHFEDDRCTP